MITIQEEASGVSFSGAGTLSVSGFTIISTGSQSGRIDPQEPRILFAPESPSSATTELYLTEEGVVEVSSGWGLGGLTMFDATGDAFGFSVFGNQNGLSLFVPQNYDSVSPLTASAFLAGETLDSLGLNEGTYVSTYIVGGTFSDSITVDIILVPEPSSSVFLFGLVATAALLRRPRRKIP